MKKLRWCLVLAVCLLASLDATASCIVLTWTATGDDHRVGRASQYDIRYSTSFITEANWNGATRVENVPVPQVSGAREFLRVSNLEEGVVYYFAMKVADERPNWSTLSNVVSRTAPVDCIGTVGNVDCDPMEEISLVDLVIMIDHLYISNAELCCPREAKIDGHFQGMVTLIDLMLLIDYLFYGTYSMPPCP